MALRIGPLGDLVAQSRKHSFDTLQGAPCRCLAVSVAAPQRRAATPLKASAGVAPARRIAARHKLSRCNALDNGPGGQPPDPKSSAAGADDGDSVRGSAAGGAPPGARPSLPDLMDGVNIACCWILGLIFIADFTPFGVLLSASSAPFWLSAMQWGVFVLPTVYYAAAERRWDVAETFRLKGCSPQAAAAAAAAGPVLLFAINAAIALKTGGAPDAAGGDAASGLMAAAGAAAQTPAQIAQLFAAAALSPAVAEELLFRGLLLTALLQKLGRVDAAMVCGALFAATHLSVEQFFQFAILGIACSGAAVATGSVLPAVILHASFNATALVTAFATVTR